MSKSVCGCLFVASVLTCVAASSSSNAAEITRSRRRPNVVVLLSDDCGFNEFSMNGSKIPTPRIDSIAENGVRFTTAYVSGSVCSPTRAGLLSGRYQQRFGHETNIPPTYSETNGLPLSETLLPAVLAKADYRTMALGKWHLGYAPKYHPMERGFSDFYGFLQGQRSYWGLKKPNRLNQLLRDRQPVFPEPTEYLTDQLATEATKFIADHRDSPFFLYVAFNATHGPLQATDSDLAAGGGNKIDAMARGLDRAVGAVLDSLKQNGLWEQTLVIFTNDNGGAIGHDNSPLRGRKGSNWEGGVRVPFAMQWPGVISKQQFTHPVISLDIFPTALAAAGIESPPELALDGVNLLPYVEGEKVGPPHHVLYWKMGSSWAVREGDLKVVSQSEGNAVAANLTSHPELFDLSRDPSETTDLSSDRPLDVKRLTALYEAWKATHKPTPWSNANDDDN